MRISRVQPGAARVFTANGGGMTRGLSNDVYERVVRLRRDLHQHPELSWQEHRTMERISAELRDLGVEHRTGVARTGIVADIPGREPAAKVGLRADTDALPIQEETGLPFASQTPGVMHACGHDGHTSMLVGAAALLRADPPPCPVRLLWQPAEECGAGAAAMIEDGALDGVACMFGGHLDRHYPPGVLAVTDGPVNASTDTFHVTFLGQQGHGARPHTAIDAVVLGSAFVTALQTIVSRRIDPAQPSVVTVGRFDAGTAPNIIAGRALLEGTIRAQDAGVRDLLCESVAGVARATAALHGADVQIEIREGTPALINQGTGVRLAREAAREVVGADHVTTLHAANMGGEDFARYLLEVPGAYIRFGAQVADRATFPAHSGGFDIHEHALAVGVRWLDRVARIAGAHLLAHGDLA